MHGLEIGWDDIKEVEFKDHSDESDNTAAESSIHRRRAHEVDLPKQHYINIHPAITGVLHISGAGKFLDKLLNKFGHLPAGSLSVPS